MKLSGRLKLTLLAGALALFFLAVLVGVLPSVLANRPETRELIRRHAAEALGGEVDFGAIRLALLPRIRASVSSPRATADGIRVAAEELSVSLRFWPLLQGRVEPELVSLEAPAIRIPIAPVPPDDGPPVLPDPRQILTAAAGALGTLPEIRLTAARGRVELAAADGTVFQIGDIELDLASRAGEIELTGTARSDLVRRLEANARLQTGPFTGSARLQLEGLRPERPYAFFFPGRAFRILDTEADLDLTVELDGPQRLQAKATAGFPRIGAGWKDGTATLADARVAATLELTETRMALRVPEFAAAAPQLALALGWVVDAERHPRIEITLEGGGDAEGARAAALPFLVDIEEAVLVCDIVRGGRVPHIRVALSGDTADELTRIENLHIEGRVEDGRIDLPFIRFGAEAASGDFGIRNGFLEASGIRARRSGVSTTEARLRLHLRPEDQTLELELPLTADDLSVLPGLLGRMIDDPDVQRELKRIEAVEGRAAGRLRLGGRVPDVTVEVEAWAIDARGRHAAVPYPLSAQGGRVGYTRDAVTLEGVDVSVGRSRVSRLDAAVGLTGARRLRAASPQADIDLGEAHAWLGQIRPIPGLRGLAGSWRMTGGRVDGPLDRPEAWEVAAAGELSSVALSADPLPAPVQAASGAIAWQGRRLRLSELSPSSGRSSVAGLNVELDWSGPLRVGLQAARAALSVDELLPPLLTALPELRAQIAPLLPLSGTVGLQAIRAEARVHGANLQLSSASAVVANASVSSAHLADPLVLRSGTLSVDGPRLAAAGIDAAFGRSEARGFSIATTESGGIDVGVAAANIELASVYAAVAGLPAAAGLRRDVAGVSGTLSLSNVALGAPTPQRPRWAATAEAELSELTVDSAFLEAPLHVASARLRASETEATDARSGAVVRMEPARVRSGHNDVQLGGALTLADGETTLELDVAAESLDWGEITRAADRIASRRTGGDRPAALKGRVRLHAEQFAFGRFRIAPLRATAELGGAGTTVLIDLARLCGMDVIGRIGIQGSQLDLYLVPVVDGASLDRTMPCLTSESSLIGGTLQLNGELYASGSKDAVACALKGWLTATAENGVIRRSIFFARVLSLLNLTEIYRGHFPDLRTQGIEFQRSVARAEFRDGKMLLPEWSLVGPTFWMGSRGEIDLTTQQIDFTIMVSPFRTADRIINSIPGLRWILGGRLVAIPMRATGHVEDPQIVPLSPTAVGTSILEMVKRTLMLPIQIIQPIVPGMEERENTTITR